MPLTPEQLRLVVVVYTSALLPLPLVAVLRARGVIPAWVTRVYVATFAICALGWELWFTSGWVAGDSVQVRETLLFRTYRYRNLLSLLSGLFQKQHGDSAVCA